MEASLTENDSLEATLKASSSFLKENPSGLYNKSSDYFCKIDLRSLWKLHFAWFKVFFHAYFWIPNEIRAWLFTAEVALVLRLRGCIFKIRFFLVIDQLPLRNAKTLLTTLKLVNWEPKKTQNAQERIASAAWPKLPWRASGEFMGGFYSFKSFFDINTRSCCSDVDWKNLDLYKLWISGF